MLSKEGITTMYLIRVLLDTFHKANNHKEHHYHYVVAAPKRCEGVTSEGAGDYTYFPPTQLQIFSVDPYTQRSLSAKVFVQYT